MTDEPPKYVWNVELRDRKIKLSLKTATRCWANTVWRRIQVNHKFKNIFIKIKLKCLHRPLVECCSGVDKATQSTTTPKWHPGISPSAQREKKKHRLPKVVKLSVWKQKNLQKSPISWEFSVKEKLFRSAGESKGKGKGSLESFPEWEVKLELI